MLRMDDALTEANRAPLEAWCAPCHMQNMADPVDHEALESAGSKERLAHEMREALAEALDMLDGYGDGRLSRVASRRERFAAPARCAPPRAR